MSIQFKKRDKETFLSVYFLVVFLNLTFTQHGGQVFIIGVHVDLDEKNKGHLKDFAVVKHSNYNNKN